MSKRRTNPPNDGTVGYLIEGLSVSTIADAIVAGVKDERHRGLSLELVRNGLAQSLDLWKKQLDCRDYKRVETLVGQHLAV